jgi:cytochrome c-type biogenesis protein CcmF
MFMVPMLPLLLLLGIGMHAAWKRSRLGPMKTRLYAAAGTAVAAAVLVGAVAYADLRLMTTVGFALAFWVMLSTLNVPFSRLRARQAMPAAVIGMLMAHFGLGLTAMGITAVQSYKVEKDFALGVGDAATIAGYEFRFAALRDVRGPNYTGVEADIAVSHGGRPVTVLHPQKRLYNSGGNAMTEAGIDAGLSRDLFAALGDDLGQGRWSVRLQYKPLIRFIWLGAIFIAIGGAIAAFDRRYRVRAPAGAREPLAQAAP